MSKVLLAEDDPAIAEPLARALARDGYDVTVSHTGQAAIDAAGAADLLLLDLGLPDIDGLDVAREVRKAGLKIPILVVTGRADQADQVMGIDAGADDYVTKPFRLAELLARVRTLIQRGEIDNTPGEDLVAQDVRLIRGVRRAFQGETELHLTQKEFDLLRVLVENVGETVLRDDLMKDVWGNDPQGSTKALDVHIAWLRRKLGDDGEAPRYIATVKGQGFRFEPGEE